MEKPFSPEIIESQIEALLSELDNHALEQFPEEVREQLTDEWYTAEMEARVGKDRNQALEHLSLFVGKLLRTPKKD